MPVSNRLEEFSVDPSLQQHIKALKGYPISHLIFLASTGETSQTAIASKQAEVNTTPVPEDLLRHGATMWADGVQSPEAYRAERRKRSQQNEERDIQ